MIEFFLSPVRVKGLLIGGAAMLFIIAALFTSSLYLSGKLDTSLAEHTTTKEKLETAVQEGVLWKAVADAATPKIEALQGEVRDCLTREIQAHVDAVDRARIMHEVQLQIRTEKEQQGVVDNGTRRKAMLRINRPL